MLMNDQAGPTKVQFLTVAEVAAMMRVSKMTVYRLVHSGELTAVRVGRSFRVPEHAVDAYAREFFDQPLGIRPEHHLYRHGHGGCSGQRYADRDGPICD